MHMYDVIMKSSFLLNALYTSVITKVYAVFQKKEATKLLAIAFSNLNRFSKFFHC